MIFNFCYN